MTARSITYWGHDGSALRVDTTTGEVLGEWVPIPGEAETRLDFPLPAEPCRCCGRELRSSGHKFAVWFCAECKERAATFNADVGRCVVPLGRHTLMAGVGTKPARKWRRADVERFVDDVRGLFALIELLEEWAPEIVRRNCVALGLDREREILLVDYLDAVAEDGIPKADAFAQLLDWMASRPER
ncbi:MAG: hypothetical protein FJW88_09645 [Actinobacteria bacterium]|nr:hypothetical protein [Actinomycetota bacterium]